jgi:hypothetical protein
VIGNVFIETRSVANVEEQASVVVASVRLVSVNYLPWRPSLVRCSAAGYFTVAFCVLLPDRFRTLWRKCPVRAQCALATDVLWQFQREGARL